MLALRIGLAVGVLGVGIGGGYAIPLSNQHKDYNKAGHREYDTRTTVEIYNDFLGNSSRSIRPRVANSRFSITPRSSASRVRLNPYAEIASAAELAKKTGVIQTSLGALPTGTTTNFTKSNKSQGKRSGRYKRRPIYWQANNVGTKARARSNSRLYSAKSRIKQRTNRKHVALRVNPQTMRERTRFRKSGHNRK